MRTIAWLAVLAACSGPGAPARPVPPLPPPPPDAGVAAAPAPPTQQECEALIAHAVDLRLRERTPQPDPALSDAESVKVDQPLQSFVTECGSLTRERYRCGMSAATVAEMLACHATRSSSTSNSSVAPPGITPPAPRSP